MEKLNQLMRVAEVGPDLGVTSGRIYQLIEAGVLPAVRVGRAIRVPRASLKAWLRSKIKKSEARARSRRLDARGSRRSPCRTGRQGGGRCSE